MPTVKETTFATDFIALMSAIPVMPKDASNPFFKSKYTPLDTIVEVVTPILAKHNFSWTSKPSFNELGEPSLKYALVHTSGERDEGEVKLLLKSNDPQGQGSAITYARRYAITSQLNIVSDEDDDGNSAKQAAAAAKPTIDPPAPEEPSVQIEHVETLSADHVGDLLQMAKAKGAATKPQAIELLNGLSLSEDFTKLPDSMFAELRKALLETKVGA
jgi:hypothetical protein